MENHPVPPAEEPRATAPAAAPDAGEGEQPRPVSEAAAEAPAPDGGQGEGAPDAGGAPVEADPAPSAAGAVMVALAPAFAPTAPGPAGIADAAPAGAAVLTDPGSVYAAPAPRRRRWGAIVTICLLVIALLLALGAGAWLVVHYLDAKDRISEQNDEIEHQKELIEQKETFGAAMGALMATTAKFDGVLTASIVPWEDYQRLAERGWSHRWDATKMAADTEQVEMAASQLETVWAAAQQEASTNATGSAYESVIDGLGAGYVRSVLDEQFCSSDDDSILGCVFEDDPYLVHFDSAANGEPFMTDELRTGIAYHEFAHVLQFTNPAATETALTSFGGDFEVMADCFALTYLDGWKLDHRIWTSDYEYWDVNIGYGQDCSEAQRQVVRDWYAQLGVVPQPVTS